MEVNFFALVEMTRLALPLLKQGNRPIVVNVSSVLGHRGVPLQQRICGQQVRRPRLQRIDPDGMGPAGDRRAGGQSGHDRDRIFRQGVEDKGGPGWPEHAPVTAAAVARQMVRAICQGRHEIIPYRWGKVLCWLNRLSPRMVDWLMTRYV